ncbi:MAG: tetratricopeptide repeat protein [Candidatus Tectomicrobia bacterium]|nr:tetratricopeptide repeat protein [Candidatus Tectomicrobia bacterium]
MGRRRIARLGSAFLLAAACMGAAAPGAFAQTENLVFEAVREHERGNLDQALALLRRAVSSNPEHRFAAYARNQIALILAKKGEIPQALEAFQEVHRLDPKNTFARLWMGILQLKQGKLDKAFSEFQEVVRVDPQNADAYYYLGAIYNFRRNRRAAIEFLKKARDAGSDDPDTHFRLAQAFHNADMMENALLEYQRTLDLNPRHTKAMNSMGWIYYNRGEMDRAVELWQGVRKLNPKDREAGFNLAKAFNDLAWKHHQAGRREEARKYWRKTLEVDPENKAAKWNLSHL